MNNHKIITISQSNESNVISHSFIPTLYPNGEMGKAGYNSRPPDFYFLKQRTIDLSTLSGQGFIFTPW